MPCCNVATLGFGKKAGVDAEFFARFSTINNYAKDLHVGQLSAEIISSPITCRRQQCSSRITQRTNRVWKQRGRRFRTTSDGCEPPHFSLETTCGKPGCEDNQLLATYRQNIVNPLTDGHVLSVSRGKLTLLTAMCSMCSFRAELWTFASSGYGSSSTVDVLPTSKIATLTWSFFAGSLTGALTRTML